MTWHVHHLHGCTPAPLAHYLKALGILRLVAEQADPHLRGWWQDEHFCLLTSLDREALARFFLERYQPTPLFAPWNAGSGFYRTWDAKNKCLRNSKNADALNSVLSLNNPRLSFLTRVYEEVIQILPLYCKHIDVSVLADKERRKLLIIPDGDGPVFPVITKDESGKNEVQKALLRAARNTPFYECAFVIHNDKVEYPSMWGTGGNDGNIDYTGRFFENLKAIIEPDDKTLNSSLLLSVLFNEPSMGLFSKAAGKVGQFLPSAAGGPNITTGAGSQDDTILNPWDFVLMLEGAILFNSRVTRRLDPQSIARASAPFVMHAHAAGFLSPGGEKDQRGEQWMPLWSSPSTLGDVSAMLHEGRLDVGRQVAYRPLDAARAVARLGVARGIDAFVRYGYLERNGQSNLAVSLGRVVVHPRPHARLIDDIAPWLDRLHRLARDQHAPGRLVQAERRLADAVFNVLTHDQTPDSWQATLRAMVAVETLQTGGTAIQAGPIPKLNPQWIKSADDGSAEMRLAVAFGSAAQRYGKKDQRFFAIDSVRHHWLPLEKGARRFQIKDKRLVHDPRVVMHGRDPVDDLISLVERRFIESTMGDHESHHLPLIAAPGCSASLSDLAALLAGHVDLTRICDLAKAFMAVDWPTLQKEHLPKRPHSNDKPDEAWLALRLAGLPWPLDENHDIRAESAMIQRLHAGDGATAVAIALRRLRACGLRPPIRSALADAATSRRWAAALAFPINHHSARCAGNIFDPSYTWRHS